MPIDSQILRCVCVTRSGIGANARKDFNVVAVDQVDSSFGIQLDQCGNIFRIDAAVIAARLPRVHCVVAILVFLDPDRRFRKQVDAAHVVPMGMI